MQLNQAIFLAALVCSLTTALSWGEKPERYGGVMLLLAALASPLAQKGNFFSLQLGVFLVDALVWLGLVAISLTWHRRWTSVACAFQSAALLGHFARAVLGPAVAQIYGNWEAFCAYPVLVSLAIGSWHANNRRRQLLVHEHENLAKAVVLITADAADDGAGDLALVTCLLTMNALVTDAKFQAVALLKVTGSLAAAMNMAPERLRGQGIAEPVIQSLALLRETNRALLRRSLESRPVLSDQVALLDYLHAALAHLPEEQLHVLYLDSMHRLLGAEDHGHGTVDQATVFPRELLRRALELNASHLILAHNHPSGSLTPSRADIQLTRMIRDALKPVDISLQDHIIASRSGHASLRAMGYI